jgi:hypothetical protein
MPISNSFSNSNSTFLESSTSSSTFSHQITPISTHVSTPPSTGPRTLLPYSPGDLGKFAENLTPYKFVSPRLHMEMGLVNQIWEDFKNWINDNMEIDFTRRKAC